MQLRGEVSFSDLLLKNLRNFLSFQKSHFPRFFFFGKFGKMMIGIGLGYSLGVLEPPLWKKDVNIEKLTS